MKIATLLAWQPVWLAGVLLLNSFAGAVRTLDDLKPIHIHASKMSDGHFRSSLTVSSSILQRHNRLMDSQPLKQYINQLQQVLQQGCCDYFTALTLVKGLTDNLVELLEVKLPQELLPALRRSYVCAVWLLQRSKLFKWNSRYMHKLTMLGYYRLYEAHIDISAGRPISFHHISKSGGTSLCQLARVNGCKGPVFSRADNCLLNKGMDGPTWVLQHDVLLDNHLPIPPPPPPPPPPAPPAPRLTKADIREAEKHMLGSENDEGAERWGDDDDDDDEQPAWILGDAKDDPFSEQNLRAAASPPQPIEVLQWFMYDCARMAVKHEGYGCRERQETAAAKSATFFANEHTLSVEHGEPQVCPAFTNLIVVRDPLSEAVSLMGEVIQVYFRLLRRQWVDNWQPPRWDLAWWQRWAPVVISSYSTRTLLGPQAFCPPRDRVAATSKPRGVMMSTLVASGKEHPAGGSRDHGWLVLGDHEVQSALERLYSFDLVLELESPALIDISTSKLLGWSDEKFSTQKRERGTTAPRALSWDELGYLAAQAPPVNKSSTRNPLTDGLLAAMAAGPRTSQQHSSTAFQVLELDVAKRMIAEVWVRKAYQAAGEAYVITPTSSSHTRVRLPSQHAVKAAKSALQRINRTEVTLFLNTSSGVHVVVKVQGQTTAATHTAGAVTAVGKAADAGVAGAPTQFYHIWPKHGVVLDEQQYNVLLKLTAADKQLHEHASLLQLLDAGWLTAVSSAGGYSKLLKDVTDDMGDAPGCGFAGLNHLQQ